MSAKPTYEELEQRLKDLEKKLAKQDLAEEALRESEERWQFALEGSRDGVWDWNVVTNEVFFSRRWKEMLGYNDDEISNHLDEWDKRVHPDDKEQCYRDLNRHLNGEVPYYENEHRILCKDGSYKWILDRGKVVSWTETNKPKRVIGTHTDITERKQAEEELRESRELLENILTASSVGIAHARERKIIWANQAMIELFGFTQEDQYIGQDTRILYADEEEYARIGRLIYEQQKTGKVTDIDAKFKRQDNSLFDGYVRVNILDPSDPVKGIIVSIIDITDRKRAEEEREKLQAQLSNALEMAHLGPWEYDVTNDLFIFNDYFYKIFNTTAEQVGGYTMSSTDYARRFLYPDDIPVVSEEIRKAIKSTDTTVARKLEHRILHADGTVGYINVQFVIVKDSDGQAVEAFGVAQNITERRQAEEALRESEEKYRLLIENATDAIFIVQDKVVKFANPKAKKITGYSAAQLAKLPFVDFIHPEDRGMVLERHLKRLGGQEPPNIYSFRIVDKSGEVLSVELSAVFINWEGRPATLNFLRDITAQKRLEAQLQQAQKMEALGTLAGGIAHDFNNLLMAIQGRASILLMNKDSAHPDFEHLRGIESHVESAADLTKQLLGFARGGKYEVKPTDLNELIKKENRMFGRTKKEITIHGKYAENLWSVEIDRGQIEQVFLNLYVNAWQAMPGSGDLYVETENVTLDENYLKPFSAKPGKYVKISVTDTGIGMDKATRERIFDPFFTTKKMGRGTGLGLASAYGIVKNHGGFINVYSEKGHGSTFNIYLPASEKEVMKEKTVGSDALRGSETVLLVDDEDMIIDVAEEVLKQLGYNVLVARSGKEAIEIYEENKERIDMVILDMIMPDISGGDTYDRMKEMDPDVKVLLSSGYSINGQAKEILDRGCNGFIQKPYKMRQLSQKLREILDKK